MVWWHPRDQKISLFLFVISNEFKQGIKNDSKEATSEGI